jgi:hypothetical protein
MDKAPTYGEVPPDLGDHSISRRTKPCISSLSFSGELCKSLTQAACLVKSLTTETGARKYWRARCERVSKSYCKYVPSKAQHCTSTHESLE